MIKQNLQTARQRSKIVPSEIGAALLSMVLLLNALPSAAFDLDSLDLNKVASGGASLAKAVKGLSDEDEIKIGREVAANLAARYGLVEDADKVRYVNLVGQAVVRKCERKKIPYRFGILHTAEINALAAPGGYIFVTQGLLETMKDESELAGVLAHEVEHVVRQHVVKAIRKANLVDAGEDLASAAGHDVSKYAQLSDFSIQLLRDGLSRADELEADRYGTLLVSRAGYDPRGLRRSIEALTARPHAELFLAHFNKTHPPASERLKMIDKTIARHHVSSTGQKLAARFKSHKL